MLKDGWIVEDFRDAPMEPLAVFRDEDDAREWSEKVKRLGEHAYIHRGDAAYRSREPKLAPAVIR